MLPALLITLRETIEASLIVATLLGILRKLGYQKEAKIVWSGTLLAVIVSIVLLYGGSLLGLRVQELYSGKTEEIIEGILMITSSVFITWAVFFLHKYFAQYKVELLQKVNSHIKNREAKGLFILAFTAVLREGIEIVLFLTTIYFSSDPAHILSGFTTGLLTGLGIAVLLFTATFRMPIYYAFRVSSILLVLFAAGMLAQGVHEFAEAGIIAEFSSITLPFIPSASGFSADILKSIFGLSKSMDVLQISLYMGYIAIMYLLLSERRAIILKWLKR